jgi:DNA (cytosine-5)-methyltransferase 1
MTMKVGSLFTGYGGLDIAVGGELAWYAEIEPAACQVLAHHYPNVPNLGDITKIDWSEVEPVDVITGGYPCQPFSHAGNRKGKNDVRHLWPNVLDAIRAIRPRYAILENVSGHLTLGFADVLADLAEIGWSCEWGTFRASDVGAPHRRERIFIIAGNPNNDGRSSSEGGRSIRVSQKLGGSQESPSNRQLEGASNSRIAYANSEGSQRPITRPEDAIRPGSRGVASDDCGIIPANTNNSGWVENVEQSSDVAATPGERQSSLIDRSGADGDAATRSGTLVASNATFTPVQQRRREQRSGQAQSRGSDITPVADASGERHGSRERPRGLERMGSQAEVSGWETSTARQEFGAGSVVIAADTESNEQREPAKLGEIRPELGNGVDAGSIQLERNCGSVDWGKYGPAIKRWESVLERAAPAPTTPGRNDRPRLNPQFVEWMMGLPDGWVTGHGLSAAKELKMLGNGVVPQQAHAAITQLLERTQQ